MSAFSYCSACGCGNNECKVHEALRGTMACQHCGSYMPANQNYPEALELLENRLSDLEQRLKDCIP